MCFVKGVLSQEVTAFFGQNSGNINVTKYVNSYTKTNALHEDIRQIVEGKLHCHDNKPLGVSNMSKQKQIVSVTSQQETGYKHLYYVKSGCEFQNVSRTFA